MRDLLFEHQERLQVKDLLAHAKELSLEVDAFREALRGRKGGARVERDVESADLSGVSGTPTFFVNGRRHHGAYDIQSLSAAVVAARDRAVLIDGASPGDTY